MQSLKTKTLSDLNWNKLIKLIHQTSTNEIPCLSDTKENTEKVEVNIEVVSSLSFTVALTQKATVPLLASWCVAGSYKTQPAAL